MKLSAKTKEGRLLVKAKCSMKEEFNYAEMERFSRVCGRGFLKPSFVNQRIVEYSGPFGVSLKDRLNRPFSKKEFLFLIDYIVVAMKKINAGYFSLNYLVLDLDYVFINEVTKEVQFIYMPLQNEPQENNIVSFLASIVYSVKPVQENDMAYTARFINFFQAGKPFNEDELEKYILSEDPSVVKAINKSTGVINKSKPAQYDNNAYAQQQPQYDNNTYAQQQPQYDNNTYVQQQPQYDNNAYVQQQPQYDNNAYVQQQPQYDNNAYAQQQPQYDNNAYVQQQPQYDNNAYVQQQPQYEADYSYNQQMDLYGEEATGLLVEEETGLLVEEETGLLVEEIKFGSILRVKTDERIEITKPIFTIGKRNGYVDYCILDNNTVSRNHLEVITRGNECFVIDKNSKNKTFINNSVIPQNCEVPINDGDELRLSNEEFIFNK